MDTWYDNIKEKIEIYIHTLFLYTHTLYSSVQNLDTNIMAPTRDNYPARVALYGQATDTIPQRFPKLSMESLHRTISDISAELRKEGDDAADEMKQQQVLPLISEVEDAKCECCGMSEECTPEYISLVRGKFSGKLICGLCSEAVKEEMEKSGGKIEEALSEHMNACSKFNKFGRTHPVLFQAQAMKEILKKGSARAKSLSPRDFKADVLKKGGIARSSSCIPAIMKDFNCTDPKMTK